ncbi:MAG TPA: hypothetical protein PKW79_04090 [Rhabdochlamydiaceae bacterium]|nr:hypothetical protein [Rhabdochlamydiaceae bacterium]
MRLSRRWKIFARSIDTTGKFKWIADAALYTKERLLKSNDYVWVTRVPENITEAKELIEQLDAKIAWKEGEGGYKTAEYKSYYGGIEQRWLLVFSEQAYGREKKTLEKKLERSVIEQAEANFSANEGVMKRLCKCPAKGGPIIYGIAVLSNHGEQNSPLLITIP